MALWLAAAILLLVIGVGMVRELFLAVLAATFAALVLWFLGAAAAALPVSAAIIIGAMIIAVTLRR